MVQQRNAPVATCHTNRALERWSLWTWRNWVIAVLCCCCFLVSRVWAASWGHPAVSKRQQQQQQLESKSFLSAQSDNESRSERRSSPSFALPLLLQKQVEWWNDLAPPFLFDEDAPCVADENDATWDSVEPDDSDASSSCSVSEHTRNAASRVTHFCFLVHGHRGTANDLSYLQTVMRRQAQQQQSKKRVVVHAVTCNERKTTDGVVLGGERLLAEMLTVIRSELRQQDAAVTVSLVGNSLGGLYARYAAAKLLDTCQDSGNKAPPLLDGRFRLRLNVLVTTASPHLGVAGHTFVRLPRTAEIGVAHAMGQTGHDLFRLNDLLYRMATTEQFLAPLRQFQYRIAYANAYGTDFPVPTETAAFLHADSNYPHEVVSTAHSERVKREAETVTDNLQRSHSESDLFVATLQTRQSCHEPLDDCDEEPVSGRSCCSTDSESAFQEELVRMTAGLDSLGWTKVFVDMRKQMTRIPVPPAIHKTTRELARSVSKLVDRSASGSGNDQAPDSESTETDGSDEVLMLQAKATVTSGTVVKAVTTPLFDDDGFHWPMGHNMIVAFSRSRWSTYMNKKGRPVVDTLAKELIEKIFQLEE
jgi:pimeloyl-ACP methyl ester carboxylesterase